MPRFDPKLMLLMKASMISTAITLVLLFAVTIPWLMRQLQPVEPPVASCSWSWTAKSCVASDSALSSQCGFAPFQALRKRISPVRARR